jgi:hypothetical protein
MPANRERGRNVIEESISEYSSRAGGGIVEGILVDRIVNPGAHGDGGWQFDVNFRSCFPCDLRKLNRSSFGRRQLHQRQNGVHASRSKTIQIE